MTLIPTTPASPTAESFCTGASVMPMVAPSGNPSVELIDGRIIDITSLSIKELMQLQFEQETAFAKAIVAAPKDSDQRQQVTQTGYTTVCMILERISELESAQRNSPDANDGSPSPSIDSEFTMGMDPRYRKLVLEILEQQSKAGIAGGFFELGFSSGALLKAVADQGVRIGGIEVVDGLIAQAKQKLDAEHHPNLLLGDFRRVDLQDHVGRYSVVYWNDVFEHIATDEILDFLQLMHRLLVPGGKLITITPNWHMRPSDVTSNYFPPRTEAIGFHLKEYTGHEVISLLSEAGFRTVHFPLAISRTRIFYSPTWHFTRSKLCLETCLERLPYRVAVQACRRLGLNLTIATK